jgi:hypothetical protein
LTGFQRVTKVPEAFVVPETQAKLCTLRLQNRHQLSAEMTCA